MKKIGVIADTHGLLRPMAIDALQGSDYIIHAGDIGKQGIVEQLSEIAPVTAVRGNVDKGELARLYPHDAVLEVEKTYIYTLHILAELDLDPAAAGFQVVVSGHSHKAKIDITDGVLYLNPGSAGPKRFSLPVSVAILTVNGAKANAEIVDLAV